MAAGEILADDTAATQCMVALKLGFMPLRPGYTALAVVSMRLRDNGSSLLIAQKPA